MTMATWGKVTWGVVAAATLLTTTPTMAQERRGAREQGLQERRVQAQRAPHELTAQVGARDTDVWRVWVSAGRRRIIVVGDGDTDLDLYVDSASGRRLAVDDDPTDYCVGEFYMRRSGYVEVRIRNLGRVYNEYYMSVS